MCVVECRLFVSESGTLEKGLLPAGKRKGGGRSGHPENHPQFQRQGVQGSSRHAADQANSNDLPVAGVIYQAQRPGKRSISVRILRYP